MRRYLWAPLVLAMLLGTGPAQAATSFRAGQVYGGLVFTANGLAWSTSDNGINARVMVRPRKGPTRQVTRFVGLDELDSGSESQRVFGLTADRSRLAWTQVRELNYARRPEDSDVGPGGKTWQGTTQTAGRTAVSSCFVGRAPRIALGRGFEVLLDPCPGGVLTDDPGVVTIDGQEVGRGVQIAAAGEYAAWQTPAPDSLVLVYSTRAHAVVSRVSAQAGWSLTSDGTVVSQDQPPVVSHTPPPTTVRATSLGGASQALFTDTASVFAIAVAPQTVAYVAVIGEKDARIVAYRAGHRYDVARFYASEPGIHSVATDGRQIAWGWAACDGDYITIARIGERLVDDRVRPCAVILDGSANFYRRARALSVPLHCKAAIPPSEVSCRAMIRVYRHGRLIASGVAEEPYGYGRDLIRLTPEGLRQTEGTKKIRATVVATRLDIRERRKTRRVISFYKPRQ